MGDWWAVAGECCDHWVCQARITLSLTVWPVWCVTQVCDCSVWLSVISQCRVTLSHTVLSDSGNTPCDSNTECSSVMQRHWIHWLSWPRLVTPSHTVSLSLTLLLQWDITVWPGVQTGQSSIFSWVPPHTGPCNTLPGHTLTTYTNIPPNHQHKSLFSQ